MREPQTRESSARARRSWIAALAVGTAGLLPASGASAQPRDPVAAEALFDAGREALRRGDYDAACAKLRESYELDPAPGALLNLGDCEEKRGKIAAAWSIFRQLARELPSTDDRRPIAHARAAALEDRIPRLVIRLAPGAPAETVVRRAGLPVGAGSLGSPLPVDPGQIEVTASAPGRKTKAFTVKLTEGERTELLVAPGDPETAAGKGAPLPIPAEARRSPLRTLGLIGAGVGAIGLGAGAVFGLRAIGKKDAAEAHCDAENVCAQEGIDLQEEGVTAGTISTVAFAVGAAALGAGAVLFFTAPAPAQTAGPPRATLGVGPGGVVATVVW
jgi:hypothetical protein